MITFFIKLLISLGILAALVYATDLQALRESLYSIDITAIIYAFCLILLIRFVMALRWKLLLRYYQVTASLSKLFEIIFVSNAVGHLLPSGIGVDIIRIYELSKTRGSSEKILASVFMDRVFGLISMLLVALLAAWYALFTGELGWAIPLFLSACLLVLPLIFILLRFLLSKDISVMTEKKILLRISDFYNRFVVALRQTNIPVSGYFLLMLLSVMVQMIRSLVFLCIFLGLGADVAVIHYFIYVPLVFILMLVPISIGGLGIRESALFAFFGPLGLSVATCTVAGLVFHGLQLVMIVPGLILFSLRR